MNKNGFRTVQQASLAAPCTFLFTKKNLEQATGYLVCGYLDFPQLINCLTGTVNLL